MCAELYQQLNEYAQTDYYPFHMPGHKRQKDSGAFADLYRLDITEIDGFDNLHDASGILKKAQEKAASLYGAEETHFLVNGSTGGLLSAVAAVGRERAVPAADKKNRSKSYGVTDLNVSAERILLMARNCHKAVYHAAYLNRMPVRYLYPDTIEEYDLAGRIEPETVRREIMLVLRERNIHPQKASAVIAGIVITSPTYDGICSDIRAIAQIAHTYGIPLIVDEAHGAHLGFHEAFPESAVHAGADLVIQSTHKTLPAPTQTALLHCDGTLVDRECLHRYLAIYQTSSPSYILMAGIEEALRILKDEGTERLERLYIMRRLAEDELKECQHIRVCPDTEPSKLVVSVKNTDMSGKQLYDCLREKYHLQLEMASGTYALAMLSMMDTANGIRRLTDALKEIDRTLSDKKTPDFTIWSRDSRPERVYPLYEAFMQKGRRVSWKDAVGEVTADFVNLYPPGIPVLVPGERIGQASVLLVEEYLRQGYPVCGICDGEIRVL